MAEKKIQTRIALKIDTLANWQAIWGTFKPMAGEKILFQIWDDPATTEVEAGLDHKGAKISSTNPPQVISKTGDGVTVLRDLPWDSALAADVAAWAKPSAGESVYVNLPSELQSLNQKASNTQTELTNLQKSIPQTYATKTDLDNAKNALVGQSTDAATANTIYGAKKIAENVLGTSADAAGAATVHGALKAATAADTKAGNAATAASQANTNANSRVLTTTYNSEQKAQNDRLTALEGKIGGVTGAMHFIGAFASAPSKNGTEALKNGDVYVNTSNNKEFVYSGNAWVELGDTTAELQAITNLQTTVNTTIPQTYATKAELNTAKSDLSKEIDSDIATARGLITTEIGTAVAAEKTRAEQAETNLSTAITTLGKKLTTVSTTANNGLKVTPTTNSDGAKDYKVDIDTDVIFVFDCGSATVNAQNITK